MIPMYLKYNWVWDFDYEDPEEPEYRSIEEYSKQLDKIFKRKAEQIFEENDNPLFMLSGGVDSSLLVSYLKERNPRTFSLQNWNVEDGIFKEMALNHLNLNNHVSLTTRNVLTIEDLMEVQSFFDHPHCRLLTFFWYLVKKELKEQNIEYDALITGAGPDQYMLEDVNSYILARAIKRKEYDLVKAIKYRREIKKNFQSSLKRLSKTVGTSYEDAFEWNQFPITFQNHEVETLGLVPFQFKLREDNVFHMDAMLCRAKDLTYEYYHKLVGFNMDVFACDEAKEVYKKIPIEAKNCLGFSKPIIRKIASKYLPSQISARDKKDWKPEIKSLDTLIGEPFFFYPINIKSIDELMEHFLINKNNRLYNYLDYDKVKEHFKELEDNRINSRLWNLINLSAWMEVHEYEN